MVPWGSTESLARLQREMDVDILVTGHTHKNEVNEYEGKWFINPGSITGAYSSITSDVTPSFILMIELCANNWHPELVHNLEYRFDATL